MYAKVFRSLWDGSMADQWGCWSVFVFLLAHADCEGWVEMTHRAIAARSGIPEDKVREAIAVLEAPDPMSRSSELDGRRLEPIDGRGWGWRIVNYQKYRGMRDEDERRRQTREAVRRYRVSHGKPLQATVSHRQPRKAQAEAEAEAESNLRLHAVACPTPAKPSLNGWDQHFLSEWWPLYRKGRKQAALKRWRAIKPHDDETFSLVLAGTRCYLASKRVHDGFKQDAETFLRDRTWDGFEDGEPPEPVDNLPLYRPGVEL